MPPKTARGPKKEDTPRKQVRTPKTSRLTGEAEISGTLEGPGQVGLKWRHALWREHPPLNPGFYLSISWCLRAAWEMDAYPLADSGTGYGNRGSSASAFTRFVRGSIKLGEQSKTLYNIYIYICIYIYIYVCVRCMCL